MSPATSGGFWPNPMQHLLTRAGEAALAVVLRERTLLVFDFDGTLAPIVPRPDAARPSQAVIARLRQLSARIPVAVIGGRSADDLRARLGFEPAVVVGNHGAEAPIEAAGTVTSDQLDGFRATLRAHANELAGAAILVEDKGLSIALHYRLSRDRERASAVIERLHPGDDPLLRVTAGRMAVEVTLAAAPDIARAVLALVARSRATHALVVSDATGEPMFASAPPGWLSVRVGRGSGVSRAHFCLDGPQEMAMMLERTLALLPGGERIPPRST
jgi:trehalose 6-phosphate phosphatase